ncbi:carbon-nitrogen hydrolase family protein [Maricaulis sp. CAU 1757]
MPEITIAAIQAAPVLFDREASLDKACDLIRQAAAGGARLAAFGETWLPGYPFFIEAPLSPLWWEAAALYLENAIQVPGPETETLCRVARQAGIDVVIGVAELDPTTRGSVYASLVFISRDGELLGRHRKLKPTHHERSVWADGDAEGLQVHDRPYGRLSGLNCWEHNILLPGFTLISQGTQFHVAAWPGREPESAPDNPVWSRQVLLSRAFASQAGAYVVAPAGLRLNEHVPERFRELSSFEHTGQSVIIDPRGEIIAGPAEGETILYARADTREIAKAKSACDPAGHYSRPDLFELRLAGRRIFPPDPTGKFKN